MTRRQSKQCVFLAIYKSDPLRALGIGGLPGKGNVWHECALHACECPYAPDHVRECPDRAEEESAG